MSMNSLSGKMSLLTRILSKDKPKEDRRRIKANDPIYNAKFVYAVSL